MSKKQKRQVSRSEARTAVSATAAGTAPTTVARSPRLSTSVEFSPDYSYVISDLKRIGILAASFIIILVVMSFFLR
jgi:hypothetical protein